MTDEPPFIRDDVPPDDDRRVQPDRRDELRGGRRRADRPDDAGVTTCPRCGDPFPRLDQIELHEYHWTCDACQKRFVTARASRVVL